jgi:HAD superfamily hydrolase (TIGR01549 family)
MDGVLVNSFECWWKLLNSTLADQGQRTLSREEFLGTWGQDVEADRRRFFPGWTVEQLIGHYIRELPRFERWIQADPDAPGVLEALKASGRRLAVASNSPVAMVERLLTQTSIRTHIDCAAGVDLVVNGKPEPDLIEYVLRETGVGPDECCYVGDSEFDACAARAAGVLFVGYRRPGDVRIESLRELPELVASRGDP